MIGTNVLMLLLRFLHIVLGAAWVGSTFLFVGFIGPSAAEVGPAAGPLMSAVVKKRKLPKIIVSLSMITVTVGWIMWIRNVTSFDGWETSRVGIGLTIGGVLATVAAITGVIGIRRNVEAMVDLGDRIAASGAPPSPEDQQRMAQIGAALEKAGKLDLALLFLAVTAMATARYW
jgi:hypothetical protein